MKVSKIFLISMLHFALITSCTKEEMKSSQENIDSKNRNSTAVSAFKPFDSLSLVSKSDAKMKFALGLSKLLNDDQSFRTEIFDLFEAKSYKEVLISDFLKQSSKVVYRNQIANNINSLSSAVSFNLNQFLIDNPLLSIRFPFEVKEKLNLNLHNIATPILVPNDADGDYYAVSGTSVAAMQGDAFVGIWLKNSEEYILYNSSTNKIKNTNLSFKEYFLFDQFECADVTNYLQSLVENNGLKLVEILKVQKLHEDKCMIKKETPSNLQEVMDDVNANGISAEKAGPCHRGLIETDLLFPELSQNSNTIGGFGMSSYTSFKAIDNQPCTLQNPGGIPFANTGQNIFSFMFTWVIGSNGTIFGTRNYRKDVLRKDLVKETIQIYIADYEWRWSCFCEVPIFKLKITGGSPKYVGINDPVFGVNDHWETENQGEVFWINVTEFDVTSCSSTNTNTQTSQTTVGGSLVFSALTTVPNSPVPTINFSQQNTITATHTVAVTGVSVQDLGNTYFEYCQSYPFLYVQPANFQFLKWLQMNTTGAVNVYTFSPWQ